MKFKRVHLRRFCSALLAAVSISAVAYAAPTSEEIPLGQDISKRFTGTVHRNDLCGIPKGHLQSLAQPQNRTDFTGNRWPRISSD